MTTTTNITSTPEPAAQFEPSTFRLQDKVVLLILTMHAPGNDKRIKDKAILDTDADKARLSTSKTLIEGKEYQAITQHDSKIRGYIRTVMLPAPFKSGVYAVPITLLSEVDAQLQILADERARLVRDYALVYDAAVERSRRALGTLFQDTDYIPTQKLPYAYRVEWQFVSMTAPDQIASLDPKVYRREQERLARQWEEAVTEMRDALRVGLSELVADMVGRLDSAAQAEGEGKKKQFKPTKILQRFEAFLSNVQARNVTNDEELAALAQQAKAVLAGVTTDELKKKSDVRAAVQAGLTSVKQQLDQLEIVSKGRRKITLDE